MYILLLSSPPTFKPADVAHVKPSGRASGAAQTRFFASQAPALANIIFRPTRPTVPILSPESGSLQEARKQSTHRIRVMPSMAAPSLRTAEVWCCLNSAAEQQRCLTLPPTTTPSFVRMTAHRIATLLALRSQLVTLPSRQSLQPFSSSCSATLSRRSSAAPLCSGECHDPHAQELAIAPSQQCS